MGFCNGEVTIPWAFWGASHAFQSKTVSGGGKKSSLVQSAKTELGSPVKQRRVACALHYEEDLIPHIQEQSV